MTIVICVDEVYWRKSQILFDSLNKNFFGRVCILAVDFNLPLQWRQRFPGRFEFTSCKRTDFKSYREDWPSNRHQYFCSESGEFLEHFEFTPDELVIHLDADMIMQRQMTKAEREQLECFEQGEIGMSPSAYPVITLREESFRLNPRRGYEKINLDFPGVLGDISLYCCGMVVARAFTYKLLRDVYVKSIDKIVACFDHHAGSQWLLNYIVNRNSNFNVIEMSNDWHNASWFIDTLTEEKNEQLVRVGVVTLFNHTKFLKDYKY